MVLSSPHCTNLAAVMSNGGQSALSGLRTIKRDWSQSSSQSEDRISWPATQPTQSQSSKAPKAEIPSQRMRDIQLALDALSGKQPPGERPEISTKQIANGTKRSLPPASNSQPAKKRQLPPSWNEDTLSSSSNFTSSSNFKSSSKFSLPAVKSTSLAVASSSSKPSSKLAGVFLSQEQTQILRLVENGNSVFYTGSAGTGKSVLLREIIRTLRKKYVKSPDAIAITASTGIAACNIGGVTIHSFAGIGIGEGSAEELINRVRKNKKATSRWLRTKVLIIDEVSMLDGDLFDKLAQIGSLIRKSPEPFGEIQVVVTGDFFQLPPVGKGTSQVKFAFEAQLWNQTIKRTFNLNKVFRQKDQQFVDMLNEMRFGRLSQQSIARFKSLSRPINDDDGLGATELFPRREDVERSNNGRMTHLQTEQKVYLATDGGIIADPNQRDKMLANFMAPKNLVLRVGAQVMLIKNMDDMLVNGSMGKILRFVDPALYGTDYDDVDGNGNAGKAKSERKQTATTKDMFMPVVEFSVPNRGRREALIVTETWKVELPSGEVQVSRTQLPLILAWAMSIHKSQGQTLERVKVDLGRVFEKGQAYVALSRATSLDGLQVLHFDPKKVQAHPKVVEWSKTLETISTD